MLLERYLKAWEEHDLDGFVTLLKEDAAVTMPPWREAVRGFFAAAWKTCGGLRLKPTAANGQPAFAIYEYSAPQARWRAHSIHVLTFEDGEISAVTLFLDPRLFDAFGPAPALDEPPPAAHR